jgi:C1A family cysteine protease
MKKNSITSKQKYGWIPDLPDNRDFTLRLVPHDVTLPAQADLRPNDIPIYDQGDLGSCTANAIAAAYAFDLKKQHEHLFSPSRLFIYYNERVIEGTVKMDAGAMIRDGIKSINHTGVCHEKMWPYVIGRFANKPSAKCYGDANNNKSVTYQRVNRRLTDMKFWLAEGNPFVIGISVYESFESAVVAITGMVPMPDQSEQLLGGHAVMVVGYEDTLQCFIVRNSWGPDWGDKGYFYLPYNYLLDTNLSDDFWMIKTVS